MLPEPPVRDPFENPPPDPALALANETVGTPIRDNAMHAAMSLVVVVTGVLSMKEVSGSMTPKSSPSYQEYLSKNLRIGGTHVPILYLTFPPRRVTTHSNSKDSILPDPLEVETSRNFADSQLSPSGHAPLSPAHGIRGYLSDRFVHARLPRLRAHV